MPPDHRADPVADPPAVLVVGTDDWAIEQASAELARAGHRVMRCQEPGAPAFPCFGVRGAGECPLDCDAEVVLSVRNRSAGQLAPHEIGVVCGLHRGLPLVAAGIVSGAPYVAFCAAVVAQDADPSEVCRAAASGAQDKMPAASSKAAAR